MDEIVFKNVDLDEPTSFLDNAFHSKRMRNKQRYCGKDSEMFKSRISARAEEKLLCAGKLDANISSWSYDMESHAKKCVEFFCVLANKSTEQFFEVSTPCTEKLDQLENCLQFADTFF